MSIARDKALQLISMYNTRDPREIAERLGVEVLEMKLPDAFRGFISQDENPPAIIVNDLLTETEKRTVIAHEIGHFLMDPDYEICMHRSDKCRANKSEIRADIFAVNLLVDSFEGEPWEIAERCGVDEALIKSYFSHFPT